MMIYPDLTFKPKQTVLSQAQIQKIHSATLEVLERIGVQITNKRAIEILYSNGAKVEGKVVRIPAWIVEEAIRKSPARVVLGNRKGQRTVFLEADSTYFGPSLDCLEYLDPLTNERRPFTSEDCRVTATIADGLPNYSWVMTIGMADDVPSEIADRVIAKQVLLNCEKPYVFCCNDANSLNDIYQMALMIAGSEERFQRAPTLVEFTQPISPLVHYDSSLDKVIFCAEKNIPLIYYAAPMLGSTAPTTMAGTIVEGSVESLTGLVISQLVSPGTPFIYGAFASIMDMATTIFSYGAPEMNLMVAAMAQMAQHYRLPFYGTAGCSDAKFPDAQAGAEAAFSCLSSALSGANLVHDSGWLDHGSVASPAYIVLVHEILYMVKQHMQGITVNEDNLALDLLEKVGPGGHFLNEKQTRERFRDFWYPKLFDRTVFEQWQNKGSKQLEERLREQTQKAMEHVPNVLPENVLKEIDEMEKHWK